MALGNREYIKHLQKQLKIFNEKFAVFNKIWVDKIDTNYYIIYI